MPTSLAKRNDDLSIGLRGERFGKTFRAGLNSFIQEARLLARFSHPGLLHVLRFWEENGTAYMGTVLQRHHAEEPAGAAAGEDRRGVDPSAAAAAVQRHQHHPSGRLPAPRHLAG